MAQIFADVIIDISHEKVDRTFQYRVPTNLLTEVQVGMQVFIPFGAGNHERKGYVVGLTDEASYDVNKLKEIAGIVADSVSAESQLIKLAWWMKQRYGCTMNQALKTVLPVKQKVKAKEKKILRCLLGEEALSQAICTAEKKNYKARERLLRSLKETPIIPFEVIQNQLNLSAATLNPLIKQGIIALDSYEIDRNPLANMTRSDAYLKLNDDQKNIVEKFLADRKCGRLGTYLIHGITGSGKTEVYMELMDQVLLEGRQVIILIPEIALTYQTVMRFYKRFGDVVSIINSRLSAGERYDQFERARNGNVQIMIGPRSALFTPFANLGLIVIDEEHEGAYKSEIMPRYHARDIAIKRAELSHASVVLGSATPSLEAYTKAMQGDYKLFTLTSRAKMDSTLAKVEVIDLREELAAGNKSIFSRKLKLLMEECLAKKEQIILFINRRGFSNFVSCRSCGEAIRCTHCDVSLTLHANGQLMCHYCGYHIPMPSKCPNCASSYIANFGVGTQKIEAMTKVMFPEARVLRMDLDTTSKKGGHEDILRPFAEGEADILIGTQMIVKGHDFPNVTLVGALAADVSLFAPDFRSAERTFQLLTQAAGRAGRDKKRGNVILQTYNPEHYSIVAAANQDYEMFYKQEMTYRSLLHYPPVCVLMTLQFSSKSEVVLNTEMMGIMTYLEQAFDETRIQIIGPVEAPIYKINDIYRKILYIKHENYDILVKIKKGLDSHLEMTQGATNILIQCDIS